MKVTGILDVPPPSSLVWLVKRFAQSSCTLDAGAVPNHDDDLFTVAHLLHHTTQIRSLIILVPLFA